MQTKAYNKDGIVMSRKQISTMRNNFQATLNYSKRFVDKHYVAAVLGTQLETIVLRMYLLVEQILQKRD